MGVIFWIVPQGKETVFKINILSVKMQYSCKMGNSWPYYLLKKKIFMMYFMLSDLDAKLNTSCLPRLQWI